MQLSKCTFDLLESGNEVLITFIQNSVLRISNSILCDIFTLYFAYDKEILLSTVI